MWKLLNNMGVVDANYGGKVKMIGRKIMQLGFKLLEGRGIGKIPWVDKFFHLVSSLTGEIEYELEGLRFRSLMYYYPKRHLLYYGRSYEPDVRLLFCSLIRKGDVVVDVGASLGVYSLLAAKTVGNDGFVYAFEPDPIRYSKLVENIRINNLRNIKAFDAALSDKEEKIEILYHHPKEGFKSRVVNAIPLDNLRIKPNVVKINVDGAEIKVLKGMWKTISNYKPKIICEVHPDEILQMGNDIVELNILLRNLGYVIYKIKTNRSLSPCRTFEKEHGRYVFIHRDEAKDLKIEGWRIDL